MTVITTAPAAISRGKQGQIIETKKESKIVLTIPSESDNLLSSK
jgi:hypothetical protein